MDGPLSLTPRSPAATSCRYSETKHFTRDCHLEVIESMRSARAAKL